VSPSDMKNKKKKGYTAFEGGGAWACKGVRWCGRGQACVVRACCCHCVEGRGGAQVSPSDMKKKKKKEKKKQTYCIRGRQAWAWACARGMCVRAMRVLVCWC